MSKVIDIIGDALKHLRVIDAQGAVDANDAADAMRRLNSMMKAWEADGINLGWQDVVTTNDTMPTPPEADEAIGYNLAVRCRAMFGSTVDQDVVSLAASGVSMLRAMAAAHDYARCGYDDYPIGNAQVGLPPAAFYNY